MRKNKNSTIFVLLAVFLVMGLFGCSKTPKKEDVIASVGEVKITIRDFNRMIEKLPGKYQDIVKNRKDEFLQELINDTLLYQEALRKNIDKEKEVQEVIEQARKKILIARFLKGEVDDAVVITDDDIVEFYESNKDKYMTPEIMRVSHILLLSQDNADEVLKEIQAGASFEDMARAKSVDPTAQRAGDIGYFPKGQLMPEFENACSALEIDQISGVVKTKLGYHIIKLTDRRQPQLRPIDEVDENIKSQLRAIKRRQLFNDLLTRLRKETVIEINEEALSVKEEEKPVETEKDETEEEV